MEATLHSHIHPMTHSCLYLHASLCEDAVFTYDMFRGPDVSRDSCSRARVSSGRITSGLLACAGGGGPQTQGRVLAGKRQLPGVSAHAWPLRRALPWTDSHLPQRCQSHKCISHIVLDEKTLRSCAENTYRKVARPVTMCNGNFEKITKWRWCCVI